MNVIRWIQNFRNAHQFEILCVIIVLILVISAKLYMDKKQIFHKYSLIMSSLYFIAIIYATIISRKMGAVTEFNYELFWSYKLALTDFGYFNQIILNILLFVPVGILWSGLIGTNKKYKYGILVALGGLFSGCIEYLQYYFQCGFSEFDDVISNVLGVILGIIVWNIVVWRIQKSS